jgi:hypothetical protein
MPVHLYGVLGQDASLASSSSGLDGRAVRAVPIGARWWAWVSDIEEPALEATPERLRQHDAVLRRATEQGYSIVPSRFGRLHADDAALGDALQRSAPDLDEALSLVRDRVEMSFLVAESGASIESPTTASSTEQSPGKAHLDTLRNRIHAERLLRLTATELAQTASRELRGIVVAERVVENPAPPILEARAHLVARGEIARYQHTARLQAAAASPSLRVAIRGPGAAYSFAAVQIG